MEEDALANMLALFQTPCEAPIIQNAVDVRLEKLKRFNNFMRKKDIEFVIKAQIPKLVLPDDDYYFEQYSKKYGTQVEPKIQLPKKKINHLVEKALKKPTIVQFTFPGTFGQITMHTQKTPRVCLHVPKTDILQLVLDLEHKILKKNKKKILEALQKLWDEFILNLGELMGTSEGIECIARVFNYLDQQQMLQTTVQIISFLNNPLPDPTKFMELVVPDLEAFICSSEYPVIATCILKLNLPESMNFPVCVRLLTVMMARCQKLHLQNAAPKWKKLVAKIHSEINVETTEWVFLATLAACSSPEQKQALRLSLEDRIAASDDDLKMLMLALE